MFFRCGVAPPHPTAKPSWGWLRVGGSKPPLKMPELVTSRKKAIPGFMAYRRGCRERQKLADDEEEWQLRIKHKPAHAVPVASTRPDQNPRVVASQS